MMAKQPKRELSEDDISNVLEHIDYGDDSLAARRHVVRGLSADTQAGTSSTRRGQGTILEPL